MFHPRSLSAVLGLLFLAWGTIRPVPVAGAEANATNEIPRWLTEPMSLADALNTAEAHNASVLKSRQDLEARYGVAIQTRAIVFPRLQASGNYRRVDEGRIEAFGNATNTLFAPNVDSWTVGVQVVQSIYEGGRMRSSLRSARLMREQAQLDYQTVVADTVLNVQVAYDDALLATNEIVVREASVALLEKQLDDTRRRFDAGVIPQFNVLRAEVELANARPPLIRARNAYRIAKQRLVNELGFDLPRSVLEDVPLQLTGRLEAAPYSVELPSALTQAIETRTELRSLRLSQELRKEGVVAAKAGYKPNFELFAGYGADKRRFSDAFEANVNGWEVGAQARWDLFDGLLTQGRIKEARALRERAIIDVDDAGRRIELEVRMAYSTFIEAKEVLESQEKVSAQAVEALRLANARFDAGTGTQLDVLSAQTALTEARTTYVRALREYSVARSRLERATGQSVKVETSPQP